MFGGFYTFVGYETDNKKIRVIGRFIFALPLACGAALDAWEMLGAQLRFDMKNLFLLFGIVAGVVSGIGLALGVKVHICAVFMCVYLFHEAMLHLVLMTKYQNIDADVSTDEFVSMWRCLVLTFIAIALYGHDSLMGEDHFVTGNWKSASAKRVQPEKKSKFDTCISYFMKYFGRLLFAGMVGVGGYCLVFVPAGRAVLLPLPHVPDIFCQIMGGVAILGALLALPGHNKISICWFIPIMVIVLSMGVLQAVIQVSQVHKLWDGMLMFIESTNGIVNISTLGGMIMLAGYELDKKCYRLFGRLAFAAPIVCQAGYFTYTVMQIDARYDMDFAFRVLSRCVGVIGGILVAFGCKTHIGLFFLCGFLFHESMQYVVSLLALQGGEHSHNLYTQLIWTKYMLAAEYLLLLGITMALFGHDRMHKETVQTTGDSKWSQKLDVETALSTHLLSNSVKQSAD